MGEKPSAKINVIMGDRALRLAFKGLIEKLVQRRGLTSLEGQQIFDVLNRETQIDKDKANELAAPLTDLIPPTAPPVEQPVAPVTPATTPTLPVEPIVPAATDTDNGQQTT